MRLLLLTGLFLTALLFSVTAQVKTIAINPGYAVAHYWYSNYLNWVEKDYVREEQ